MANIVHLTSAHPRYDTRIFIKQCRSLRDHGHDVTLVVADGRGAERVDGVEVVDVGRASSRLNRIVRSTRAVLQAALRLDADVYQLHDPELLPAGLRLKRQGKRVVFDAHEDVPTQLLAKPYLGAHTGRLVSAAYRRYQDYACRRLDGLIAATPFIRMRLASLHPHTVDINNYPLPQEFDATLDWDGKAREVCYVGGIAAMRGIRELVRACALLQSPAHLTLAGTFEDAALEQEVAAYPGWARVQAVGHLDRAGVRDVMARAMAGLVTLHPVPNYLDALPVKMFEYMAAGLPVIASHFPLWREIVEGNGCGVCVDPGDPAAIAAAIDHFCRHPHLARRMGENGRHAVHARYNWHNEAAKLVAFYDRVLAGRDTVAPAHPSNQAAAQVREGVRHPQRRAMTACRPAAPAAPAAGTSAFLNTVTGPCPYRRAEP